MGIHGPCLSPDLNCKKTFSDDSRTLINGVRRSDKETIVNFVIDQ